MVGDVCHRYIQDGDMVMLNRQPSLWSSSVQAFRARVFDDVGCSPSSIRLNVEVAAKIVHKEPTKFGGVCLRLAPYPNSAGHS